MPKLHFYFGAMSAGKSALLIQSAHNYTEKGFAIQILSTVGELVSSRTGLSVPAKRVDRGTHIHLDDNVKCLFVDEAQFLTAYQVYELLRISEHVPIMAFGLRTNYLASPFEGSAYLLSLAHELHEIKSLCACGKKATMNARLDGDGQRILTKQKIMDLESQYTSLCSICFYVEQPADD